MVAEGILHPPQIRRFGSDLELRFEQPLVMAFARTQHHPVFAEGDRLLVLIGSDMSDGENRHCNPMIRLWIACIFAPRTRPASMTTLCQRSWPQMNETPGSLLATDEPPPFTVDSENGT